jgi:cytoplasmic iron level regulating protein YaaA (DUF328/UPF0246 family)
VLILLPPSEGKSSPRRGKPLDLPSLSFPVLTGPRRVVLDALVDLCTTGPPERAAEVLGLGRTQTDLVHHDAALATAPTARADAVYSGVLYDALDPASLTPAARRRATSWLAVTSGLFGLLRPSDRIPAYRLSPQVSLPGVGTVARHWGACLTPAVEEARGRGLVIDLRSGAYVPFWRPGRDETGVVSLRVLHEVGGRRSVVSHFNKATKGRLVRSLLEDGTPAGSVARLVEQLRDLGWLVEQHGTRLDVVVADL